MHCGKAHRYDGHCMGSRAGTGDSFHACCRKVARMPGMCVSLLALTSVCLM